MAAGVPPRRNASRSRLKPIDVNNATFEQFRELGMTVTQATRVIAYRDRAGGFGQVDDLDAVPGFPKDFLGELKERFTA